MQRFRLVSFLVASFLLVCITLTGCTTGTMDNQKLEEQVLKIIRDNPQVIIESVQAYQQQEENQIRASRQAFLQQMLTNPAAVIGNSPTLGASAKNIVLVEFSDFQCPFCARAHQTIKAFMEKYKNEVTLTYKHLPLASIHPQAMPAAKAAWAAQQQGKFWEYYDALFTQQKDLGENLYVAIAGNLNLDLAKFNRDRQSKEAEAAINQDLQLARQLGINGTPFFFLNQEAFSGALELPEIEQILAKVKQS